MAMLFALVGAVPLIVGGAGLAAFLLQRAGFGIVVWGLLPVLGMLAVVGVLGVVLGKAAVVRRGSGRDDGGREGRSEARNRKKDGV